MRNDWLVAAYKISKGGKERFDHEAVGKKAGMMRTESHDTAYAMKERGFVILWDGKWNLNTDGEREAERIIRQRDGKPSLDEPTGKVAAIDRVLLRSRCGIGYC
jgi:hypothetical protein